MSVVNPERLARMRRVLDQRLGHVRLAIEAVYHRHNVSAILRTADSMGLQHVHLVEGHFVPAKGAARGSDRWLTLHRDPDPATAIRALQDAGFAIWVADLADDAKAPEQVPLDRPVCVWMGAELAGVGPEAREAADGVVTVPMRGFAQSLNVSVAAALTLRPIAERARALGPDALLPAREREGLWQMWDEREHTMRGGVVVRSTLDLGDAATGSAEADE